MAAARTRSTGSAPRPPGRPSRCFSRRSCRSNRSNPTPRHQASLTSRREGRRDQVTKRQEQSRSTKRLPPTSRQSQRNR
jgi:hypothetical protein